MISLSRSTMNGTSTLHAVTGLQVDFQKGTLDVAVISYRDAEQFLSRPSLGLVDVIIHPVPAGALTAPTQAAAEEWLLAGPLAGGEIVSDPVVPPAPVIPFIPVTPLPEVDA
jgi:hypothetical protein